MTKYAKNTSVPMDRSMNQIRVMLQKAGADGVAMAEAGNKARVQFVFEKMPYQFTISYPDQNCTEVKFTNTGKKRTTNQIEEEIEKEKRRLWRSMNLYIKAAIEAHQNGLVDIKRSMMGNLMIPSGGTMYEKLEADMSKMLTNPQFLLD